MKKSRREFIRNSVLAASGAGLVSAMGKPFMDIPKAGANDRLVVGLIGCNGMGFANLEYFLKQPDVECAAMCDVDANVLKRKLADLKKMGVKKPDTYGDFRKLLERKDIDAVIIGTPDHWHCIPMVMACQAGKDVYVEKPLARTIEETEIMLRAAKKYNRVVQVGQWQRSDPHWQDAVKFVHSGNLGRVRLVKVWAYIGWKAELPVLPDEPVPEGVDYDFWLGPAPMRPFSRNRFHFSFRWFWDYAGGLMTDWGVHLLDYALFGMNKYEPESVVSSGGKYAYPDDAMETPDTQQALYEFDGFGLLWDHTIGIYGGPYGRRHGVAFIGEYGTLVVDRGGWEVIPEIAGEGKTKMEAVPLQPSSGKGLELHIRNFIDCVKNRERPNADVEIGAHIAKVAHLGNIAYRTGRKVVWNAEENRFINDPEADEYIRADYRKPWELPKV